MGESVHEGEIEHIESGTWSIKKMLKHMKESGINYKIQ